MAMRMEAAMAEYRIRECSPDTILLKPAPVSPFLFVFVITGAASLALALLAYAGIISPPSPFLSVFIGFGLVFTCGALIFTIRTIPGAITFSTADRAVVFDENGRRYQLPFSLFRQLIVTAPGPDASNRPAQTCHLNLVTLGGNSLTLMESADSVKLQTQGERIAAVMGVELVIFNEIVRQGSIPAGRSDFPLPPQDSILRQDSPGRVTFRWHSRKSLLSTLLLGGVIAGFNVVILLGAIPSLSGFDPGLYAAIIVLGLLDVTFSVILLFSLFGSSFITVEQGELTGGKAIFGFSMGRKSFSAVSIAALRTGLSGGPDYMTILTREGMALFDELARMATPGKRMGADVMFSLLPKILELRHHMMNIDASSLYFHEKLYLLRELSALLRLPF